jgi:predicted dehydrogenase
VSILVIGGGKMGMSHLAIASRLLGPGEVSLCDSSRLVRYVFGKLQFATFDSLDTALLSQRRWRGAIVATPTSSHFAIAKALLERGIACFIEKPLTLNAAQSQVLADLQARSGTLVQMGLVARFIQPFARLRRIARSGQLGPVLHYRARMLGNVVTKPDNDSWRTDFRRGGGCLNEYGPHLLDLCRAIFGEVSSLASASFGHAHSTRADDSVQVSWVHANGAQGELLLDWCDTSRRKSAIDFEVHFEHAVVQANNAEFKVQGVPGGALDSMRLAALNQSLLPYPVSFYLRGEDYSLQLEVFLERVLGCKLVRADIDVDSAASMQDGLAIDCLIRDIAKLGELA